MILLFIVTFSWLALLRHYSFNSSGFDLGIYDQVTWNTLHGRFFFYTTTGQPLLHFSNHVSPNILLLAPFYLIHSGPETLLVLQPVAIALGGLPLFWLAREKLNSAFAGLTFLAVYLLFPVLQIVTLWDYHPPIISVGFFMFAFYFLEKRRPGLFLACAILAMMGKEQLPLQVTFLGLYAMLRHGYWRWGLITIGLALGWFFTMMYWIIPVNSVVGEHIFLGYYADLGDSPLEIVITALTRPDIIIQNVWQPAKLKYIVDVFTPFSWLSVIGLPVLLIGTPSFAINLLSANPAMHDATQAQYGADIAPWLAWSALFGAVYLRSGLIWVWTNKISGKRKILPPPTLPLQGEGANFPPSGGDRGGESFTQTAVSDFFNQFTPNWLTNVMMLVLLSIAVVWHLFRGFSPLALDPPYWEITPHDELAYRFIDQIPPDASLSAQGKLYPHLSNRIIAYQLPDINQAEYVFIDITRGTWPIHPNDLWAQTRELVASGEYGVQDAADGYLLLRRGAPENTFPDAFYDFARRDEAEINPQFPLTVDFGDELRLLGYDVIDDQRREETSVRLYWQALQPIEHDLRLYPFFVNNQGHVIETTEQRPLLTQLWYPPEQWQAGEIVIAETMPWALGEQWSLAVGVQAGDNWADWGQRLSTEVVEAPIPLRRFEARTWVRLHSFERQGRRLVEITPNETDLRPTNIRQANLGNQLQLLGYDATVEGQTLPVTLYWQATTEMSVDYTIFVHLLNAQGELVAQHDNGPWWEVPIPTSTWQAGEQLRDQHILELSQPLPAGDYELQIGVYYWETLERLPVLENDTPVNNFISLGTVSIAP